LANDYIILNHMYFIIISQIMIRSDWKILTASTVPVRNCYE